jgi:hypothetical protein
VLGEGRHIDVLILENETLEAVTGVVPPLFER